MHPHNDTDGGTANALEAVRSDAVHVQGTVNGFGERTGNANLPPIVASLRVKMGMECISEAAMSELTVLSAFVDEVANMTPDPRAAYTDPHAITDKSGPFIDALIKSARTSVHT